jgi:hypothetical protein
MELTHSLAKRDRRPPAKVIATIVSISLSGIWCSAGMTSLHYFFIPAARSQWWRSLFARCAATARTILFPAGVYLLRVYTALKPPTDECWPLGLLNVIWRLEKLRRKIFGLECRGDDFRR